MSSAVEAPPAEVPKAEVPPPAAPTTALAPAPPKREAIITQFDPKDPVSLYMDTGRFEQLQRVAVLMAASMLVPVHLQKKVSDCFLVAAQAFRWGMDPFSVAQHTFVLSSKLGYEGKLIAGLINASGRLEGNLAPTYTGERGKATRGVVITGRIKGETKDRTVEGTVAEWQTQNAKWKEIPDQMLVYRGAREWARRHMPEVMLGITADDELVEPTQTLQRVDGAGGTRTVPALDVLAETVAEKNAAEKAGATVTDDEGAGGSGAAVETCESGTRVAAEGERCDHGVLITDDCPSCIVATKGTAPKADAKPVADTENPFIKKRNEAAAKEQEKAAAGRKSSGDK